MSFMVLVQVVMLDAFTKCGVLPENGQKLGKRREVRKEMHRASKILLGNYRKLPPEHQENTEPFVYQVVNFLAIMMKNIAQFAGTFP